MQIVILGQPDSWHVQDFVRAGEALGHVMRIVEFRQLTAYLQTGSASLQLGEFDILGADRVLVRSIPPGSLEQVVFRMDALHRLRLAGVRVLNPPGAIEACVDKYLATARLAAAGLPVPRTAVCEDLEQALVAFERLGGDVVVKPLFGSEGRGMLRIDDESLAYRSLRAIFKLQGILYLQEFVDHPGHDVRAMVLGNRVIASMRRNAASDFRTNVSRGGTYGPWELPREWTELALRAARAVGAPLAGVDLLPDAEGNPLVVEVNSVPGFKALRETTPLDVAKEILQYLIAGDWVD